MIKYCPECGAKVREGTKFCGSCGKELIKISDESNEKISKIKEPKSETLLPELTKIRSEELNLNLKIISTIIEFVLIIAFLLFITVPEILTCPECHGTFLIRYFCSFCGGDGKVTIVEYILYLLGEGFGAL